MMAKIQIKWMKGQAGLQLVSTNKSNKTRHILKPPRCFIYAQLLLFFSNCFSDYIGYVTEVTSLLTSKDTGNHYYDVRLKTSPKDVNSIRVMTKQNPAIKRNLFQQKKDASQPVKMTQLTKTETGIIFFNSNQGSRIKDIPSVPFMNTPIDELNLIDIKDKFSGDFTIKGCIRCVKDVAEVPVNNHSETKAGNARFVRDAIISDGIFHLPISVWGDTINQINESQCYKLTHTGAKHYFGQKLYTKKETTPLIDLDIPVINSDNIDLNPSPVTPKKPALSTLKAPEVVNVKLTFYPVCRTPKCNRKKLKVLPGDDMVDCGQCNHSVVLEKCKYSSDGEIQFEDTESREITLTVFPDTLNNYFKEDVIQIHKDNLQELKRKILRLTDITVSYNSRRIITESTNIAKLEDTEAPSDLPQAEDSVSDNELSQI